MRLIETTPDSRRLAARLIGEAGMDPGALMLPRAEVEAIVAMAISSGGDIAIAQATDERHCRVCGCGDLRSCRPPCSWVEDDLCSVCAEFPEGA